MPVKKSVTSPGRAVSARIKLERDLSVTINAAVARFLREVRLDALAALGSPVLLAAARRPREPFTLGAVDRHWIALTDLVSRAVGESVPTSPERTAQVLARLRSDPLPMATFEAIRDTLLRGQLERWTQRKVRAEVNQAIRIGQSHADRIARTEATAAFNADQIDAIDADPALGSKTWVATMDARTRPAHAEANGQTVPANATFDVGGEALAYPGDPSGSDENTANCRCVTVGAETPGE